MGGGRHSKPWRELPADYEADLRFVKDFKTPAGVQHIRILLHGQINAGKSAFINSVSSVVKGRISADSLTDASPGKSFTQKYTTYKIWKKKDESCSFVFNDTMGLEESVNGGVHVDDIKMVLKGHVRDGYKFHPEGKINEEDCSYNQTPTFDDRVHVLVSVIAADNVEILPVNILEKMKDIRLAASDLGIPQIAVLTKVDEACPEVKKNIKSAYSTKVLNRKVEKLSVLLGLPPNCIFFVQNYHSQTAMNQEMNALIVFALKQMIEFGEDFIAKEFTENNATAQHP